MPTPRPIARAAALAAPTGFADIELRSPLLLREEDRAATRSQILGVTASRGVERNVVFARRTDNAPGTGSFEDPFDGSSAALIDAALRPLSLATASDVNVTFLPSATPYETFGSGNATVSDVGTRGFWACQRWTFFLHGATLKLVETAALNPWVLGTVMADNDRQFRVYGGVIDCNQAALRVANPDLETANGIGGRVGSGTRFCDVEIRGHYAENHDGGAALEVGAVHADIRDVFVERVRIHSCAGQPIGIKLWCNHHHDATAWLTATVRDCDITLPGLGDFNSGINYFGVRGTKITGTQFRGCYVGIFNDTAPDNELVISGNDFETCGKAVFSSGDFEPQSRNVEVIDNRIVVPNGQQGINVAGINSLWRIARNRISLVSGSGIGIVLAAGAEGHPYTIIDDNIIDDALTNTLPAGYVLAASRNRTETGALAFADI